MWSSQLTSPNGSLSHWVYRLTGRRYFWIATPVVSMIQSEKNRMHPEVHEHIDLSILICLYYMYIYMFWKHWRPEPAVNLVYNSKKILESPNLQVSLLPLPKEMKLDSNGQLPMNEAQKLITQHQKWPHQQIFARDFDADPTCRRPTNHPTNRW